MRSTAPAVPAMLPPVKAALRLALPVWLACAPASAQTLELGKAARLHYQGNLGVVQWGFPREGVGDQGHFATQLLGELDLTLSLAPEVPLELRVHPRVNFDPDRDGRFPARFDDLYLDWFTRWFELRAGWQVFSWKTVESVSQADILNQADREEDFFDPPKMGEPSARARLILPFETQSVLELYWLPWFTPSPLPGPESRYDLLQGSPATLARDEEDFVYGSRDGRYRQQWALRYQTQLFDAFDAALYGFHGYRRFPLFVPAPGGSGGSAAPAAESPRLTHFYPPMVQAGFTFQGALGSWLLKGETAYNRYEQDVMSRNGGVVDPWFAWTAGFEYTFYSPFIESQDLGTIVELIGDTDAGKDEGELDGFRPFRSHVFAGLRYAFNNPGDRSLLGGVFADYLEGDLLYRLEYKERVLGRVSLRAEVSGVDARGRSLFQPFERAARVAAEAKYHF